jgi:hypothetical protein
LQRVDALAHVNSRARWKQADHTIELRELCNSIVDNERLIGHAAFRMLAVPV